MLQRDVNNTFITREMGYLLFFHSGDKNEIILGCHYNSLSFFFGMNCVLNLSFLKISLGSQRDGTMVKSTDHSSREPGFDSQLPDGGSQLSVTLSQNLMPSSGLQGYQACLWYTCIHPVKTFIHINKIKKHCAMKEHTCQRMCVA